jgi:hypothetical protein
VRASTANQPAEHPTRTCDHLRCAQCLALSRWHPHSEKAWAAKAVIACYLLQRPLPATHHDTRHHRRSKVCATSTVCQSHVDRRSSLLLAVDPHKDQETLLVSARREARQTAVAGSTPSAVVSPQTQNVTSSIRGRARYVPVCSPAKTSWARHTACERIFHVPGSLAR